MTLCFQVFPHGMEVRLYNPPAPQFDASIIILLLIAVFTVAVGGFWSGAAEKSVTSQVIGHLIYSSSCRSRRLLFSSAQHFVDLRES